MLKHILFLSAAFNTLILYWYAVDDHLPEKFTIIAWGLFTAIMLFLEALKGYYVEKTQAIVNQQVKEITENNSLTDEEKKDRIEALITNFIVDKIKTKEKKDE